MADNFFNDDTQPQIPEVTPEVFKVGEKEYSQDDLQKLVGLGELAQEAEEKWNTPINKVFPEYTRATQELKKLKEEQATKLNLETQPIQTQPSQLTPEQRSEAIRQLKDLGVLTKDEAQQQTLAVLQARDLVQDIDGLLKDQKDAGNPATTRDDLLGYMKETGIGNPRVAYKVMFETELDKIKEEKLSSIKSRGMVTTEASTAGSKQPAPVRVTKANLGQVVADALQGIS